MSPIRPASAILHYSLSLSLDFTLSWNRIDLFRGLDASQLLVTSRSDCWASPPLQTQALPLASSHRSTFAAAHSITIILLYYYFSSFFILGASRPFFLFDFFSFLLEGAFILYLYDIRTSVYWSTPLDMAGNEKIRSSAAIVLFLKSLGMGGRQKKGENKKNKSRARSSDEPELVHWSFDRYNSFGCYIAIQRLMVVVRDGGYSAWCLQLIGKGQAEEGKW